LKTHNISLESLTARGNKTELSLSNGEINLTCPKPLDKNCGRAVIPQKYSIPFRVNLTLKADATNFNILMGKGFVHFSHAPNESGSGMRRQDIFTGKEESTKHDFSAVIPLNKYFNLSVVVDSEITWIEIDNICYYPTRKAQYIGLLKEGMPEEFADGLGLAIGVGKIGDKKGTHLTIKSIEIIEYESGELDVPVEIVDLPELSPFEWYLKSLPDLIRNEAEVTNDFLLNEPEIKSIFKFKRALDKHGNASYVSACGLQYRMMKYKPNGKHILNWVQKPNRSDYTSEILNEIAEMSPDFANKLFDSLLSCSKTTCGRNTVVAYKGQSKTTCASSIYLQWTPSEMDEAREYITMASNVIAKAYQKQ